MRIFANSGKCGSCRQPLVARLAPELAGRAGDACVTLWHYPFEGCACGRRRRQHLSAAAVAGAVLSHHVPRLVRERWPLRRRRCSSCDGRIGGLATPHRFRAECTDGAHTFVLEAELDGYACQSCGEAQVDGGDDRLERHLTAAIDAALKSYSLREPRSRRLPLLGPPDLDAELLGRAKLTAAHLAVDRER